MAKIRKLYDETIKPNGNKEVIYPITSTNAVYLADGTQRTVQQYINQHSDDIDNRINTCKEEIEGQIDGINNTISAHATDISNLSDRVDTAETDINTIETDIIGLKQADIAFDERIIELENAHFFEYEVVNSLPENPGEDTMYKIYFVPSESSDDVLSSEENTYDEYITVRTEVISEETEENNQEESVPVYTYRWELIGTTKINLDDYATKAYVDDKVATFLGYYNDINDFPSNIATENDYVYLSHLSSNNPPISVLDKYVWIKNPELEQFDWKYVYSVPNVFYDENQWNALNSGITADKLLSLQNSKSEILKLLVSKYNSNDNTWNIPRFDSNNSYNIGDYVIYTVSAGNSTEDIIFKFTSNYNSGDTIDNKGTRVSVLSELEKLYKTLSNVAYSGNYSDLNGIPSNLSDFAEDNDSKHYTATEKNKLSGIAAGAQVNVIENIKVNDTLLIPENKTVNIEVPTDVSQLTDNSDVTITETGQPGQILTKTQGGKEWKYLVQNTIDTTYADLVALKNENKLTPGQTYRITDYETLPVKIYDRDGDPDEETGELPTFNYVKNETLGKRFDLILTATSVNTFSEKCNAGNHIVYVSTTITDPETEEETTVDVPQDDFLNEDLSTWEIWYTLDNRKEYVECPDGKGIIYRMIDNNNNDLPFDFKNIIFKNRHSYGGTNYDGPAISYFYYDEDDPSSNELTDYSRSTSNISVKVLTTRREMTLYSWTIPNITIMTEIDEVLPSDCDIKIPGSDANELTICNYSKEISISGSNNSATRASNSSITGNSNTIVGTRNTIEGNNNVISGNNNIFTGNNNNIVRSENCNISGDYHHFEFATNIVFRENCNRIHFSTGEWNEIDPDTQETIVHPEEFIGYYRNIIVEPNNSNINLYCDGTVSYNSPYQNVTISACANTSNIIKTVVDHNIDQTFNTVIQAPYTEIISINSND